MNPFDLMFISGWATSGEALAEVARGLSPDHACELLALPELQDQGAVGPAETLAAQVAARGMPTVLVGWSTGALLALETAVRQPDLARALILLSGTACFCQCDGYTAGTAMAGLRVLQRGIRRTPRETLTKFFANAAGPETLTADALTELVTTAALLPPEHLQGGLEYLRRTDLRASLSQVRVPVLLLHGTDDRVVPCAAAGYLAAALPDATLIRLAGAGHLLPRFQAAAVAGQIRTFLRERS